jgi:hypothetical protein
VNQHDEQKSGSVPTAGASSSSSVRVPQAPVTKGASDSGEHVKSPRPKAKAAPPNGQATEELPETYGVDEVEILCKDPWWYFAYWEVTETGLAAAREQLGPSAKEARLILRVFATGGSSSAAGGARSRDGRDIRDVPVQTHHGRRYLEAPRPNSLLRVAIGLLSPEGFFAPIAHSSLLRVPPQQPSAETNVEWLHVLPAKGDGRQHERIVKAAAPTDHAERALPWRSGGTGGDESVMVIPGPTEAGGSSERSSPSRSGG